MNIIYNEKHFEYLKEIQNKNILLITSLHNQFLNVHNNELLISYVAILDFNLEVKDEYIINHKHEDILYKIDNLDFIQNCNVYVFNKKRVKRFINENNKIFDISLLNFINEELIELNNHFVDYNKFINKKIYNQIIPFSIHVKNLNVQFNILHKALIQHKDKLNDFDYLYYNFNVLDVLYDIEKNGLCIDKNLFKEIYKDKIKQHLSNNNLIYSEYNIYTSTNRPSNKYGKINFSALNKKDRTRECFISRYEDGSLYEFDYSAYHLSILADIVNYVIPKNVKNLHEYLGKIYFNTKELTKEQYEETKTINFKLLYGGIPKELNEITFFKLVNEYIDKLYNFYLKNKYIESHISKRRIYNIESPTPNKVMNYMIQMLEMEITMNNIKKVNFFIKDKKIKIILYVYDSILIDIDKSELKHIDKIEEILKDKYFITTKSSTNNYKNIK